MNMDSDTLTAKVDNNASTEELLGNLGRFPSSVLPVGLLRELQARGDSIHDGLVAAITEVIEQTGPGLRSDLSQAFFAFALLVPIATKSDQAIIDALTRLPDESREELLGELFHEAVPRIIADFFKQQNASDVFAWLDRVMDQMDRDSYDLGTFLSGITVAVARGCLDRSLAIDTLVNGLAKRADQRYDLRSASIVCELINLSAKANEAVDALVRECFKRNQIDLDMVGLGSWESAGSQDDVVVEAEDWSDVANKLSDWGFDYVTDDLSPVNATYQVNSLKCRSHSLSEAAIPPLLRQVRESTREKYPREAVQELHSSFAYAYNATIDLLREEVQRFQGDPDSVGENGAYLSLLLTVANGMPLPTDLLETILQMTELDREQLYGDQFGLLVRAVSLTPQPDYSFVEQWIWNADRSDADRREMVEFYVNAYNNGLIDRKTAISALATGLQRACSEEPLLIVPYAEQLALLSPPEHTQLLNEITQRDDVDWFLDPDVVRRMSQDAEFAKEQFNEQSRYYSDVNRLLAGGVMFDRIAPEPSTKTSTKTSTRTSTNTSTSTLTRAILPAPEIVQPTTIRKEVRAGRNDPCPCGSGKKYKKCCLNKTTGA